MYNQTVISTTLEAIELSLRLRAFVLIDLLLFTEAELQAILQENERKQQIFKTQEFSLADVERINMERQELQRSIEGVETDIKNTEQQVSSSANKHFAC